MWLPFNIKENDITAITMDIKRKQDKANERKSIRLEKSKHIYLAKDLHIEKLVERKL